MATEQNLCAGCGDEIRGLAYAQRLTKVFEPGKPPAEALRSWCVLCDATAAQELPSAT
jgi:hypothetical protein